MMRRWATSVTGSSQDSQEPILNVVGELVAIGPIRHDLLPLYQRWINDFRTLRTLNITPRTITHEQELAWYEGQVTHEDTTQFTVYERATLRPIGTTTLASIDHRNGTANFAAIIGEADYRGQGYGTEVILLTLDWAFTALGLRNIVVRIVEFNEASRRAHQKAGFCEFGRRRQCRIVGGQRWDEILMECLTTEFESPVLAEVFATEGGVHLD
jgi:diamine N-acetyltransferase